MSDPLKNHQDVGKAWRWVYGGVAIFVVLLAGVFLWVANKIEKGDSGALVGNQEGSGVNVGALPPSLAIGRALENFHYETLSQKRENFYDFKDKVVIVNFWASWCGPCLEEVPSLMALAEGSPQQVQLIAISADNARKDIDVFLKAFPNFTSTNRSLTWDANRSLRQHFRVSRFPETFIFDRQHVLRKHVVGAVDWRSSEVRMFIQDLFK